MTTSSTEQSQPRLPIIDWKAPADQVTQQLGEACRDYGFFYLSNHGIDSSLIDQLFSTSKTYFSQSQEEKVRFLTRQGDSGYVDFGQERLDADNPQPEPKECFNFADVSNKERNLKILPEYLKAQFNLIHLLEQNCNQLGRELLRHLAAYLEIGSDEGGHLFFEDSHILKEGQHSSSTVRFLHYVPKSTLSKVPEDEQDEVRCGCHSDYGSLTFLFQDEVGGLQVIRPRSSPNQPKDIINVVPIPGCVVVNAADLLQFWTDSYYISAQHQVISPRDSITGKLRNKERYSMTYFMHPTDNSIVRRISTSPKVKMSRELWSPSRIYEHYRMQEFAKLLGKSFTAFEYLQARLTSTYSYFSDKNMGEDTQDDNKWIKELGLVPHPEGGYWKDVWTSPRHLTQSDSWPMSTSIYYLLTSSSPIGKMHKVSVDVLNFIHSGKITFVMISPQGNYSEVTLGHDSSKGERLQLHIPSNFWRGIKLVDGESEGLISEVCTPGFQYQDHCPCSLKQLQDSLISESICDKVKAMLYD